VVDGEVGESHEVHDGRDARRHGVSPAESQVPVTLWPPAGIAPQIPSAPSAFAEVLHEAAAVGLIAEDRLAAEGVRDRSNDVPDLAGGLLGGPTGVAGYAGRLFERPEDVPAVAGDQ
jgi:hypothetical protein